MTVGSAHLRGIVIAGGLAALALALGFVTLMMNQTASQASVHVVLPLKARHHVAAGKAVAKPTVKPRPKPKADPHVKAALAAGLPGAIAKGFGARPVVVVQLTSGSDSVAELAAAEARSGAALGGAAYVAVNVDHDGGAVEQLTRTLGKLPDVPASLVYQRPAKLVLTLIGFSDRTVVQQAAADAKPIPVPVVHVPGATPAAVVKPAAPPWSARANTLCRQTLGRLATLGAPNGTPAQIARYKSVSADFVTRFTLLKPVRVKAASVTRLDTLVRQQYAAENSMLAAAQTGNTVKVEAESASASALEQRAHALERQLGATACAQGAA